MGCKSVERFKHDRWQTTDDRQTVLQRNGSYRIKSHGTHASLVNSHLVLTSIVLLHDVCIKLLLTYSFFDLLVRRTWIQSTERSPVRRPSQNWWNPNFPTQSLERSGSCRIWTVTECWTLMNSLLLCIWSTLSWKDTKFPWNYPNILYHPANWLPLTGSNSLNWVRSPIDLGQIGAAIVLHVSVFCSDFCVVHLQPFSLNLWFFQPFNRINWIPRSGRFKLGLITHRFMSGLWSNCRSGFLSRFFIIWRLFDELTNMFYITRRLVDSQQQVVSKCLGVDLTAVFKVYVCNWRIFVQKLIMF